MLVDADLAVIAVLASVRTVTETVFLDGLLQCRHYCYASLCGVYVSVYSRLVA